MIYYVSHCFVGDKANIERARKITHDLQVKDIANCYICPLLAFSDLEYGEMGYENELEIFLDLLSACDVLIVASEVSNGVQREIDFAKLVKMEVLRLDENGELQPFTE